MEREGVERETENANIEADKVALIQNKVSGKQADAEHDLAKAEPAVLAAMSALDTLDKSQLGQCKTMSVPPPGVVDIFIACMVSGWGNSITDAAICRHHSCAWPPLTHRNRMSLTVQMRLYGILLHARPGSSSDT